jgi:organic radical activating enzyme
MHILPGEKVLLHSCKSFRLPTVYSSACRRVWYGSADFLQVPASHKKQLLKIQKLVNAWLRKGGQQTLESGGEPYINPEYTTIVGRVKSFTRSVEAYLRRHKMEAGNKKSVTPYDVGESIIQGLDKNFKMLTEIRDLLRFQV